MDSKSRETKRSLQKLPTELLIQIATMISPFDRASLALVNRDTYLVMKRALKLSSWDRYDFLHRLERDGVLPLEILCQTCAMFHPPRQKRVWSLRESDRRCIFNGDLTMLGYLQSPHLPYQVYYDIVAAICRSHRLGSGAYTPKRLASHQVYTNKMEHIGVDVSARMISECLVLKTELRLVPAQDNVLRSVRKLRKILESNPPEPSPLSQLGHVCQHVKWADVWPFPFGTSSTRWNRLESQQCQGRDVQLDLDTKVLHECLWTHERTCWTRCDANSRITSALEKLWACKFCSTDYYVSTQHVNQRQARDNVLILTSWKNLGAGRGVYDTHWREHMDRVGDDREKARSTRAWCVAQAYEGEKIGSAGFVYYASPQDMFRLAGVSTSRD